MHQTSDDSLNLSQQKTSKQSKTEDRIKKQANQQINSILISEIDWDYIKNSLPIGPSETEKKTRELLFKRIDSQNNGHISLTEIFKGLQEMGEQMKVVYTSKKCLLQAFNAAKSCSNSKNKVPIDYIDKQEFRTFLIYVRQYFEYQMMFKKLDTDNTDSLTLQEFRASKSKFQEWGFEIRNIDEEFQKLDFDGSGTVIFDEFADYCIKKSLGVINSSSVEAQKILLGKQSGKEGQQELQNQYKQFETPFKRVKGQQSTNGEDKVSETKDRITDQKNLEKKISSMTYEQLEELQNELRIENMQLKEENRQIKNEIQVLNKQTSKK